MNYYISDLHFCCASQLSGSGSGYDEREYKTLEEMHADMLARWNRKVTNGDTVYILGDISKRGKSEELIALVAQLKGHKILVHGNHDDLSDYRLRQLFEEVCNYKEITDNIRGNAYKLVLCHYPILFWNGQHRGNILLYGHTHRSPEDVFFQDCIKRLNERKDLHEEDQDFLAINVGCMQPYMKDTTKSERIALVKQWEEEEGCENSGMNLMEYFRDYIDGKKEIAEVNAAFRTNYVVETPETEEKPMCGMGGRRF